MNKLPQARTVNIVVQNLADEILIYDLQTDRAYCLNQTLAKVYQSCDGKTSLAEAQRKNNFSDELIYFALDALEKENLLEKEAGYVSPFAGMSRREVIRKVGLASMVALPVISGLIAPMAASAASNTASCLPLNQCFAAGTVICPPGCTANNFITTFQTTNGTCVGGVVSGPLNCTFNQGRTLNTDYSYS